MQRFRALIALILTALGTASTAVAGTSITFNGATYTVPSVADANWGQNVSNYLTAIAGGTLQKTGGSFTLTNDANFGFTYGLVTQYVKSQTVPVAGTGVLRLGNGDGVTWRNAGNSADLALSVNGSNVLTFNGTPLVGAASGSPYQVLTVPSGGGAGAYGAVALGQSAAVTGTLGVASGGTGLSAGTSGGVLAFTATGTLTSSNALPANGVLYGGGAGFTPGATAAGTTGQVLLATTSAAPSWGAVNLASSAAVTGTLAVANGGTGQSSKTAAFNALAPVTTKGDLVAFDGTNAVRFGVGADGTVLSADSAQTSGLKWISPLTNPMTTSGDIIVGGSAGAANRLPTTLLGSVQASISSQTATITIATPGVLTVTTAPATGTPVYLTTTGALPTGLSASTTYFAINASSTTLKLATSLGNALAGTAIATSGSQSGTHTMFTGGLAVSSSGLPGFFDGSSAASGYLGEYLTQTRLRSSATSITTATDTNVTGTALTLTPGDWEITGMVGYLPAASTTITVYGGSISTTSATTPGGDYLAAGDGTGQVRALRRQASFAPGADITLEMPTVRASLSATTTFYLVANISFATSTCQVYGQIKARRVR